MLALATQKRRVTSRGRGDLLEAQALNQIWTMDCIHDNLACGSAFQALNIMDSYSPEALEIEADTWLPGQRVVCVLERIVACRGKPQLIQVDHGSEFRGVELDKWAHISSVCSARRLKR